MWQEERAARRRRRRRARRDDGVHAPMDAAPRSHRRAHADRAHLARALPLAPRSRTSPPIVARAHEVGAHGAARLLPVDRHGARRRHRARRRLRLRRLGQVAVRRPRRGVPLRAARSHRAVRPRTTGWFGHEQPFAFTMPEQQLRDGVWRYHGGTPAVAALYQARAGAEIVAEIGVEQDPRQVAASDRRASSRAATHAG